VSVSDRQALDQQVINGAEVPAEALQDALAGDSPPQGDLRIRYGERLLDHALETRDPEWMERVADLMDAEPDIDQALTARMNDMLEEQPDAVYAFVRNHLTETQDKKWLRRLKLAALFSLRVAINDADAETIVKWLTLVAREPASYDVSDVLHYGILSAQERARKDPELARQLVLLAAKRDLAGLEALLNDQALLIALPNNVGKVLRDMEGDPLLLLQNRGAEIFLVGMARAARARSGTMFTPAVIAKLWELYTSGQPVGLLPPHFQAESILVRELIGHGAEFLKPDALESLLSLLFANKRDDLILEMFAAPDTNKHLLPLLVPAMERAQRSVNEALDLIGRLTGENRITPTQAASVLVNMLDGLEWSRETLPLMQQLARMLQQHSTLSLPPEILRKLLEQAAEFKDEFIARQVVKRLLSALDKIEDEAELAASLRQTAMTSAWSDNVRQSITSWWRGFARAQSLNRLGRLEKVMESRRTLEPERNIVLTLIALRRMLGGHSLQEFAANVQAAYTVLEGMSESFDPDAKHPTSFDPPTVREELNARDDQLAPEERQVLASNLKEVARLIAEMGDARTKSNIIRREDDVDRDLMSGEQPPHSAVDAMKWLAGYWGATREEEADDQA
jgi:hypothetical protein